MLIRMGIAEYRKTYYTAESAPSAETIRRQIRSGILPGEQPVNGGKYYVLINNAPTTGNDLADSVLKSL